MSKRPAACCAALLLVGAFSCTKSFNAQLATGDQVTFVSGIKGHDIVVAEGNEQARIRLVGIYTFDPKLLEAADVSALARGAVDSAAKTAAGGPLQVELVRPEVDPRGRFLGFLERGGEDLGRSLIAQGLAG